jgi:pyridoxal phosphate-dependent aminotransferase EpsN
VHRGERLDHVGGSVAQTLEHVVRHGVAHGDAYRFQAAHVRIPGASEIDTGYLHVGEHTNSLTALTLDPRRAHCTRDALMAALAADRIESRPTWKPMHQQPLFAGTRMFAHDPARAPVCERLFAEGVCLPSGSSMSDADLERVISVARAALAPAAAPSSTRTHEPSPAR